MEEIDKYIQKISENCTDLEIKYRDLTKTDQVTLLHVKLPKKRVDLDMVSKKTNLTFCFRGYVDLIIALKDAVRITSDPIFHSTKPYCDKNNTEYLFIHWHEERNEPFTYARDGKSITTLELYRDWHIKPILKAQLTDTNGFYKEISVERFDPIIRFINKRTDSANVITFYQKGEHTIQGMIEYAPYQERP